MRAFGVPTVSASPKLQLATIASAWPPPPLHPRFLREQVSVTPVRYMYRMKDDHNPVLGGGQIQCLELLHDGFNGLLAGLMDACSLYDREPGPQPSQLHHTSEGHPDPA